MARGKTWHEWGAVTTAKETFDAATMKIIADTAREQVAAQEERKYMADMSGEFAKPYEMRDGKVVEVENRIIDAAAPAGQLIYCALDSGRWLRFQANGGELDGRRIVSEEGFEQLTTVQIPVDLPGVVPDHPEWGPTWLGLGLGPALGTYRGRRMIYASGGIDGFRTDLVVLPEERIGVLTSSNLGGSGLGFALSFELADRLLGLEPRPWLTRLRELEDEQRTAAGEAPSPMVVPGTAPSHPLEDYPGEYEHPGYGVLRVTVGSEGLEFGLGELDFTATHRHFDTWTARYEPFDSDFPMTFVTDAEGEVAEVVTPLEPMTAPIRFTRRQEEESRP